MLKEKMTKKAMEQPMSGPTNPCKVFKKAFEEPPAGSAANTRVGSILVALTGQRPLSIVENLILHTKAVYYAYLVTNF
jgi:hypothetical protein